MACHKCNPSPEHDRWAPNHLGAQHRAVVLGVDHTMPRAGVVVFGKNLTEPSKTMICVVRNEEQLAHPWREAREQSSGFTHPSGPADASDHNPVCTAIRHFEGSTGLSQNCLVIVASGTPSRDGSHFFPALWRGPTECTEWRPRADNASPGVPRSIDL